MSECTDGNGEVVLDSREAIYAAAAELETCSDCKKKITLKGCHLSTTTAATLVNILRKNKECVEELVLDKCKGRLDIVLTVACTVAMPKALSIFLDYPPSIAFEPLAHSIGVGLLTNSSLEELKLDIGSNRGFYTLTSDAARSLEEGMSGNTTLSTLHIKNCRFAESSAVRILAEALRRIKGSLRDVRLAFCCEPNGQPLEDRNIACLIRALDGGALERLNVTGNQCLDYSFQALALLVDGTQIKAVDVSFQHMNRDESMPTFSLVGPLGRTSTLETLTLQSNNLSTDFDMACLAAALTHNTSIKHINLSDNNISSSAMNILSSQIPFMKVLENLWIEHNPVAAPDEHDVSENLAKAMKENTVIRSVACDPKLADYKTIRYYADLNWGGRGFLPQNRTRTNTSKNDNSSSSREDVAIIPSALWPMILSRTGRLSKSRERRANVIYFLLQQGSPVFPT